jgi:hypothetical protein
MTTPTDEIERELAAAVLRCTGEATNGDDCGRDRIGRISRCIYCELRPEVADFIAAREAKLKAQVATLEAELELLRKAGATVLRGFDDGAFVRDTRGDGDPAWAIKLLPYLRALAALDSLDAHRAAQSKEAKP